MVLKRFCTADIEFQMNPAVVARYMSPDACISMYAAQVRHVDSVVTGKAGYAKINATD